VEDLLRAPRIVISDDASSMAPWELSWSTDLGERSHHEPSSEANPPKHPGISESPRCKPPCVLRARDV